ncbi:hypothetical protein M9435_004389 [Picochlorum sp. BPE23]|nr:hypothetical protein M9435_004389 [Picochlorum sp. BPE23]
MSLFSAMMENSNRIRKYCILSGTAALVGYVAYEAYSRNLYDKTVRYIESVRNSVNKYRHAVDTGGDLVDMLVTDVYEYMSRESDDEDGVPKSVKRLAALMQSDEVAASTKSTVRAVVEGLFSQGGDAKGQQSGSSLGALDKVLGALLSDKGQSLVSVALSMAASNAVKAYVEGSEEQRGGPGALETLFGLLADARGRQLAVMCISACANSAMRAYVEETIDVNYYDQILSTMVKPQHVDMVKECIAVSIRAAVKAYVGSGEAVEEEEEQPTTVDEPISTEIATTSYTCMPVDDDSPCSALRPPTSVGGIETPVSNRQTWPEDDALHEISASQHDDIVRQRQHRTTVTRRRIAQKRIQATAHDAESQSLLRALGREWVYISQDKQSRDAMVSLVGCATKEAVGAVAHTIADRIQPSGFMLALLAGILLALCMQIVLRTLGII